MSLNERFVKDFGSRALRYLQTKTRNPDELKEMQRLFTARFSEILDQKVVETIIEDAKMNVEVALAEDLRTQIQRDQRRLVEVENSIDAKRQRVIGNTSHSLEDGEDDIFSQLDDPSIENVTENGQNDVADEQLLPESDDNTPNIPSSN